MLSYPNCSFLDYFFSASYFIWKNTILPDWLNLPLSFPEGIHYWFLVLCIASVPLPTLLWKEFKIWSKFPSLILVKWYFGFVSCSIYGWPISILHWVFILQIRSCTSSYKHIADSCWTRGKQAKFTPLPKERLKCRRNSYGLWWASFLSQHILRIVQECTQDVGLGEKWER